MKHSLLGLLMVTAMSGAALAHPHADTKPDNTDKSWPYFGDNAETSKSEDKNETPQALSDLRANLKQRSEKMRRDLLAARKKHDSTLSGLNEKNGMGDMDDLKDAARALEDMFAESDILENMAEMIMELADDIEIDNDDDGMSLRFNGKTLGSFNLEREGRLSDTLSMESLGKNMVIDKETFIEDGRKRTRIVIEMDGGDDVEIEVKPKSTDR